MPVISWDISPIVPIQRDFHFAFKTNEKFDDRVAMIMDHGTFSFPFWNWQIRMDKTINRFEKIISSGANNFGFAIGRFPLNHSNHIGQTSEM
jgi:hypothetical protein